MSKERVINIIGSIDEEALSVFTEKMQELVSLSNKPIRITLSSGGGSSYDALAFASIIRLCPCDVIITAVGCVASAAVIVLAAGHYRKMSAESWVMVHEDSGKIKGDVATLERESEHLRHMENQWADLLESFTTTNAAHWRVLHKNTTYLTAKECLQLGLVDEVV